MQSVHMHYHNNYCTESQRNIIYDSYMDRRLERAAKFSTGRRTYAK